MKRFPQVLIFIVVTMFAVSAFGQKPLDVQGPKSERPVNKMSFLRELGLTQDQIRQMRSINQDVRTRRQTARMRMKEASENLDQAIYADTVDEALFARRLKEMQEAQAEVAKVNFESELAIRKVLTPEQLVRFREMRRNFHEKRENFQRQRRNRNQNRDMRPRNDQRHPQPRAEHPPTKQN